MQAILVIAHKNIDQVTELSKLLRRKFEVYVHVDKKCMVPEPQMNALLSTGAYVLKKVDVRWGGGGALRKLPVFCLEKP